MTRRAFNANPPAGVERCSATIVLRDKSTAQCMRRAVASGRCRQHEVALIDRTYLCRRPDGSLVRVNVFDMNLAIACGDDRCVQCEDSSWIRPSSLTIDESVNV